jgi:hypothetical protein
MGQTSGELSLKQGEVVYITQKESNGTFPSSVVVSIEQQTNKTHRVVAW